MVPREGWELSSVQLAFIAAEPREFSGFLRRIGNVANAPLPVHWARTGTWKESSVLLIANGAGARQSSAAARAVASAAAIISVGFCGALDADLNIGEIIVADKVFFRSRVFGSRPVKTSASFRHGAICSSARIVATRNERDQLRRSGAVAVEMEAGGIASYALEHGIPFFCVRTVSDRIGESFSNDFNAALGADGRYRLGRLIGSAMLRPHRRLPELMRLKKQCDVAAESLGEFLDSCTF